MSLAATVCEEEKKGGVGWVREEEAKNKQITGGYAKPLIVNGVFGTGKTTGREKGREREREKEKEKEKEKETNKETNKRQKRAKKTCKKDSGGGGGGGDDDDDTVCMK